MNWKLIKILVGTIHSNNMDVLWFLIDWFRVFTIRRALHFMIMKHIEAGRDWNFYEQYSAKEILRMKLDGTEDWKLNVWHRAINKRSKF